MHGPARGAVTAAQANLVNLQQGRSLRARPLDVKRSHAQRGSREKRKIELAQLHRTLKLVGETGNQGLTQAVGIDQAHRDDEHRYECQHDERGDEK